MKKVFFLLILSFLVLACAYNTPYEQQLRSWVGKPEQALVVAFGTPTFKKVTSNGQTLLTYIKQNEYLVPTEYFYDYPGWVDADVMYDPFFADEGMPPYAQIIDTEVEEICQTTFTVMDGIVQSYRFKGNGCR